MHVLCEGQAELSTEDRRGTECNAAKWHFLLQSGYSPVIPSGQLVLSYGPVTTLSRVSHRVADQVLF